jgi:uncharacterized protein YdgA (DUF945 family)
MNKRILAVVVVVAIAVVLLSLPFLAGILTESHLRQRLSAMSSGSLIAAELTSYERRWFSSTARIDLSLGSRYAQQLGVFDPNFLSQRLPVLVEITHGPLAIRDGAHFGLSKVVATSDPDASFAASLRDSIGIPYVFEFRGRAGFGGGLAFDADVPPIDYSNGISALEFSGIRAEGLLTKSRMSTAADLVSLDYSSPLASAVIDAVRVTAEYEFRPGNIALGDADLAIARIAISSGLFGTSPIFSAADVSIRSTVSLDELGADMRVGLDYSAESVTAGANFSMTDADVGIALDELEADAMHDYYAAMRLMTNSPSAAPDEMMTQLQPVIDRLLEGGPTLTLDPLRFSLDGEPLSATIAIESDPAGLPAGGSYDVTDPTLWLAYANVRAQARASKTLAERMVAEFVRTQLAAFADGSTTDDELDAMAAAQAGFWLVTLAGQGMIEDSGDTYVTDVTFAAGELSINGTQVPFGLP